MQRMRLRIQEKIGANSSNLSSCGHRFQKSWEEENNVSASDLYNLLTKHTFREVGRLFKISDNAVRKGCKRLNIPDKASYYREKGLVEVKHTSAPYRKSLKVAMLNLDGVIIKEFDSAREASDLLGINRDSINRCAKGTRKTYKGYQWKYID